MSRAILILALAVLLGASPALAREAGRLDELEVGGPVQARDGLTVGGGAGGAPIRLLPSTGTPAFLDAHAPSNAPQSDGIYITPSGPFVDYCSVGGCLDGPHLRAHMLINTTTKAGPDAQENALAINFTSKTGSYKRWAAKTAFATGDYVKVFGSVCSAPNGGVLQTDLPTASTR